MYRPTATAIELNGQQSGHILHLYFVCCHPGGRRGNMEQVVAQWQRLVTFMKALDLLHQVMCPVLHHHTAMTIRMTSKGGTFVCCCHLFCLIKTS
jgi:hypothetical protein